MGLPPTARHPVYGPVKKELLTSRSIQGNASAAELERREKEERKPSKPKAVKHLFPFRDDCEVLRNPNGSFATETAPKHKRPERLPPFAGPRKKKE